MDTPNQILESLNVALRQAYVLVEQYIYTTDESQQSLYDDSIGEIYTKVELDISLLESSIIPTLSLNTARQDVEFSLFRLKERYKDIRAMYRWKKVNEKAKYLESLYLKSFDKSELQELNGETSEPTAAGYSNTDTKTKAYNSIDDDQLQELSAQEKLLQQNTMLTDKLQNVNNLMKSTLLAGEINLSELEVSTSTLANLSDSYAFFGNVLNKTNTLVKSINKASKNERAMIYRSLYFFITVCCWILWRRIFKRPVLLLIWLIISPMKLLFRTTSSSNKISSSVPTMILSATMSTLATTISTAVPDETIVASTISSMATSIIEEYIEKDEL